MVESLIFLCLGAIYAESERLRAEALAAKGTDGRRKRLRRLKQQPIVRLHRIMNSAVDYKYAPRVPNHLSQDERVFYHALANCPRMKIELDYFFREVMMAGHRARTIRRSFLKVDNCINQHEELLVYPYPDLMPSFKLNRITSSDEDLYESPRGRTYAWYLDRFGQKPAFASSTTYGNCQICGIGLPVWRSCITCAFAYFASNCPDIYVRSLECTIDDHQLSLQTVTKCHKCGGPPDIAVLRDWSWHDRPWGIGEYPDDNDPSTVYYLH